MQWQTDALPDSFETVFIDQSIQSEKITTKNQNPSLTFDIGKKSFAFDLNAIEFFAPNFKVKTNSGNDKKVELVQFYYAKSSTDENDNILVQSVNESWKGKINIENKSYSFNYKNNASEFLMTPVNLKTKFNFPCNQIDEKKHHQHELVIPNKSSWGCSEAVGVYIEVDHDMYQSFNSNIDSLVNYVASVFAEVFLIYSNEQIPIEISEIFIWDTQDPYRNTALGIYDFADSLITNGFNGHLAHLITNDPGQNGGTAYIDQLCGLLPFGYSDFNNDLNPYPLYSWDVQVLAHELGHNFGSHHTHDCVWGEDGNSQIDDCGNLNTNKSCYDANNPIIPAGGGTIMSYCHDTSVGIDLSLGFGTEPGNLLRYHYQDCLCQNNQCLSAIELDITPDVYYAEPDDGYGATSHNAHHADWFKLVPPNDGKLTIGSCMQNVDSRVWLWSGDCNELSMVAVSDDSCISSGNANYASHLEEISLDANQTYYIEWDNRWSNQGFIWEFEFVSSLLCDAENVTVGSITGDSTIIAKQNIIMEADLTPNSSVTLHAGQTISLEPGFDCPMGSNLIITLSDCEIQD